MQSAFNDAEEISFKIRHAYPFIGSSQSRIKLYKQTCKRFNIKLKKKENHNMFDINRILHIYCCMLLLLIE